MNRKVKIVLILVGGIILLFVIAKMAGGKDDSIKAEVETAELRTILETVSASGKIQPEVEVKITSEVSGQITQLPVKEGDLVKAGDLLLQINPDIYESALNRAEAALNTSRSNLANAKARLTQVEAQFTVAKLSYERNKKLYNQSVISEADWDNAKSSFEVAEAEVKAAEQSVNASEFSVSSAMATRTEALDNLKRTTILAPQDGIVTALTKEAGESVLGNQMMAGEVIMKVSDLNNMEVNVEVNESDIVRVSSGDTAEVEIDAYQDEIFKGIVTEIGNTALNSLNGISLSMDQVTNFSVKIRILRDSYDHLMEERDSTYAPFRPGMSATVDIQTALAQNVVTIPIKAVTTRLDTAKMTALERIRMKKELKENNEEEADFLVVFKYEEGGKASIQVVETGIQDNRYIHVKSGLAEGDKIISGPYTLVSRSLKDGDNVEIDGARRRGPGNEEDEE